MINLQSELTVTKKKNRLSSDEELLQTLLTGLSSKGANFKNQGGGCMGALTDARARIAQGAAEEQQSKVKLGMSEKELAEPEQRNRAFAKEVEASMKQIANLKAVVQGIEAKKIANCGWSEEKDQDLERQSREAREELKYLTEVCFRVVSLVF
jgi:structural maintenance of chromosome 2